MKGRDGRPWEPGSKPTKSPVSQKTTSFIHNPGHKCRMKRRAGVHTRPEVVSHVEFNSVELENKPAAVQKSLL